MTLQSLLVDLAAGADSWKRACRVAAVANITLSGEQTIDGVAVVEGERVLATAQTLTQNNGPWVVQLGAWTRPPDFDASSKVVFGSRCMVTSGTVYAGTSWALTSPVSGTPVLGVTGLTWTVNEPGEFTAELAAVYTHAAGVASIKPATSTFVRGATQGGLLVTPGADNAAVTLAGKNVDGTTAKPLAIELGADGSGGADLTEELRLTSDGVTFFLLRRRTAGGVPKVQFIGGDGIAPATDGYEFGGTSTSFQPTGLFEVNPGTSCYLGHDDGAGERLYLREGVGGAYDTGYCVDIEIRSTGITRWDLRNTATEMKFQYGSSDRLAYTSGAVTMSAPAAVVSATAGNAFLLSTGGFISIAADGHCYISHAAGSAIKLREAGTDVADLVVDANGVCYLDTISGVASVEFRHNGAARVVYDANDASLIGGTSTELRVESGAQVLLDNEGVEHRRIYVAPFVEKTNDTIATVLNTGVLADGVYECEGVFVLTNNTDNEGATYRRFASFKVVSGTSSQIGTTDAGGYVDKADAGQGGATATIDDTATGVVRMRFTPPSGNTDTLRIMPTLIVHRIDLA